uniref:Uncharacterized protein n=1 Tax=Sphaerodactylus townsendi TaxID=933632 RepID=A0ACB8G6U5_9SAUR
MNGSRAYRCGGLRWLEGAPSALPGSLLFAAGLAGNALALGLLWHHHHRRRRRGVGGGRGVPAFQLLIGALAATDLLGKCLLSPVVLAAYARNRSLSALWPPTAAEAPGGSAAAAAVEGVPPGGLCQLFACLMAFFGLAPSLLLLAMALDVWLSLGRPYCYQRHARRRRRLGALLGGAAGALCALFCALPLLGFGAPVQYCPGTWCFLRMAGPGPGRAYALLYASLLGLLVLAVGLLNLATMRSLCRLARRQPPRGSRLGSARAPAPAPAPSRLEELGHLTLLALMTVVFTVCSLPLIVGIGLFEVVA